MKSKLLFSVMLAILIIGFNFVQAQNQEGSKSNVPEGASNFYKNLFGLNESSRGATDALVYIDFAFQNDFVVAGLTNLGFSVTVAISWADFDIKLSSGSYGLAVAFDQGYGGLPTYSIVQNFINSGGCMIFADWTCNNTFAGLFEASFTFANNQPQFTLTDTELASGVTNPVILTNPGYNIVYSSGLTAIGCGQSLGTFPNGDAAIVRGNNAHTIILGYLSDTPPFAERQQLFENVIRATFCGL